MGKAKSPVPAAAGTEGLGPVAPAPDENNEAGADPTDTAPDESSESDEADEADESPKPGSRRRTQVIRHRNLTFIGRTED